MSPPDVASRIEEFLTTFRELLLSMPESEIRDHADALNTKLLKPIQKLQTEASDQFGRIQQYGPEIFHQQEDRDIEKPEDRLPWEPQKDLAHSIKSLDRSDLLETWDRMIHPWTRSRVVSCVYGNTFPLKNEKALADTTHKWNVRQQPRHQLVNNFPGLIQLRKHLDAFDDKPTIPKRRFHSWNPLVRVATSSQASPTSRVFTMFGIGCMLGVGVVGLTMAMRNQKMKNWKR